MVHITVTQRHVLKGIINSITADPVALAAQDAGMRNVQVGLKAMTFEQAGKLYRAELPKVAQDFIRMMTYTERHEILKRGKVKVEGQVKEVAHKPFVFSVVPVEMEGPLAAESERA